MVRHAQVQSTQRHCTQRHCSSDIIQQRGFTLVELLVVITIIGVLMAMLIPVIGRVREYAHRVQCISNQTQIGLAMTLFATSNGKMPYEMSSFQDTSGTYTLGWAESLMSQLGRADLVPSATFTEASCTREAAEYLDLDLPQRSDENGSYGWARKLRGQRRLQQQPFRQSSRLECQWRLELSCGHSGPKHEHCLGIHLPARRHFHHDLSQRESRRSNLVAPAPRKIRKRFFGVPARVTRLPRPGRSI